jgi:hypothetical protein
MEKIFVTLCILFGIYILVFVMIMTDLWSGIRKAKSLGEERKSYKYRSTVKKTAQYYNVLIALTVVDSMQMSAVWYFEQYYHNTVWFFPFMTLGGAFFLCLIEIKSIYEKAEDKEEFDRAGQVIGRIILNKDDKEEIARSIKEYLNNSDNEDRVGDLQGKSDTVGISKKE